MDLADVDLWWEVALEDVEEDVEEDAEEDAEEDEDLNVVPDI